MTEEQWKIFCNFKTDFKKQIEQWNSLSAQLAPLQKSAAQKANTPDYPIETPIVYNTDLDKITKDDDIKLIVIGDNPGKDEQLKKNNRYLCGQAGKIADGFFKRNPELKTDFRKNVIILNKTPVHSAKTNQLKTMMKEGGEQIVTLIMESQIWMAEQTAKLHSELCKANAPDAPLPELWLVGYGELKNKGFFTQYKETLKNTYLKINSSAWENVYVFQHFSMNRFTIDLAEYQNNNKLQDERLITCIHKLGNLHKEEIFN